MLARALQKKAKEQAQVQVQAQVQASGGDDSVVAAPVQLVPVSGRVEAPAGIAQPVALVVSLGSSTPPIAIPSPKAPAKSPVGDSPVALFGNRPAGVRQLEWLPPQFSNVE